MPIAHVCTACGESMAFVRAVPDPHYQLPIVCCPQCGTASIRRRPPGRVAWHQTLRLGTMIWTLLIQLALLWAGLMVIGMCTIPGGMVLALLLGMSPSFVEVLDIGDLTRTPRDLWLMMMFMWLVAPVAIGTWVNVSYGHLSFARRWLTFVIGLWGCAFLAYLVFRFLVVPTMPAPPSMQGPDDPTPDMMYGAMRSMLLWWSGGFLGFTAVAQLGYFPALGLRRLHATFVRQRYRMRRRSRRAARTAHS